MNCSFQKIGDASDGARWLKCKSCNIIGKAYAYPHPLSHVRCFLSEPWEDDYDTSGADMAKGVIIAMGVMAFGAIAFVLIVLLS